MGSLSWGDIPWNAPGISWNGVTDVAAFKSFLLMQLPVYVGFFDADGDAIGYRRPISITDVSDEYAPSAETIHIRVECRTGFGDGAGSATHCSLVFRAGNADQPGKLWLEPDEIEFESGYDPEDMTIGSVPVDFLFRETVRQHVTLTLEI